jgi:hypothetical protein
MRYANPWLSGWIGYYGRMSERTAQRLGMISRDVERRRYSPTKLMSDVLDFWMQGTLDWCTALKGSEQGVATVFFDLRPDTEGDAQLVPIDLYRNPKPKRPKIAWLHSEVSGSGKPIEPSNVQASLVDDGCALAIDLIQLAEPKKPLALGTYQLLVHLDGQPLAHVLISVAGVSSS